MSVSLHKPAVSLRKVAQAAIAEGTPVEFVHGRRFRRGEVVTGGRSNLSCRVREGGRVHVVSRALVRPVR